MVIRNIKDLKAVYPELVKQIEDKAREDERNSIKSSIKDKISQEALDLANHMNKMRK